MRRAGVPSLVGIIVVTIVGLALALASSWRPLLGLDLQGGVAVVLQPTEDVDEERLNQAISIIRSRVDALGVAEPDITRQGENIVVQLPGVDDQDRALELVGQTAELRFRPVFERRLPPGVADAVTTTTVDSGDDTEGTDDESTTTTVGEPSDEESTTTTTAGDGADEESLGELVPAALPRQTTTTVAGGTGDTTSTTA
ncbi:MAG: hypothetical protein S0880_21840, partial [Actinomycetota bacterium]|nr:hypothetical protein [Actinomycetota bacterium]